MKHLNIQRLVNQNCSMQSISNIILKIPIPEPITN